MSQGGNGNSGSQVISLPKGGGAMQGIGEKFSPDLHTGTGNFTVPIALPPGRNGFQPQINLVYSTGNGNGAFGLGWGLSIPRISRQTTKGIPRYQDYAPKLKERDTFILSGAEDLVPVYEERDKFQTRYQPRTEGLFAHIFHHYDPNQKENYWEVRSKDGLISYYGTQGKAGNDTTAIADPNVANQGHIFVWKLSATEDAFQNRIEYQYLRDQNEDGPHHWDQLYLSEVRYMDYLNGVGKKKFLVRIKFKYETRPDLFSEYRAGFEIRTRLRCKSIDVCTCPNEKQTLVRTYEFIYLDERTDLSELEQRLPHNKASFLSQVVVVGYDDTGQACKFTDADENVRRQSLPPLEFGYTVFRPEGRKFEPVTGADLPAASLSAPNLELVDLHGNGLPDILEMNGVVRYWRNLGAGKFDLPRLMQNAPPHSLSDPGVQMLDANGDGRLDLMVTNAPISGYYALTYNASWDKKRSFQKYKQAPSFDLKDPEVKLIDLNGDGVTDATRSGTSLECIYNDPHEGWSDIVSVHRKSDLNIFPNVNFSDPRIKFGDMTGDGLQDIVSVYDGNIEYWPNLGYGKWGRRIHMQNSPRFQNYGYTFGYDPKRILIGDVDGDGCADVVYVDDRKVVVWINQDGNSWSDPIVISGTPVMTDANAVRLVDLYGTGVSGVLWSADASSNSRPHMFFLDFTGGAKPYVMNEMDNHMGAVTKVQYAPSTRFYLDDAKKPATRWKTPLPFPVQVVERVEVIDAISHGKLTTQYRYHHGYWDGAEHEFRGFATVEQLDTEIFKEYKSEGLHGVPDEQVEVKHFSPPLLTKTWFHQGPVGEEFGNWEELDRTEEYWQGDPELLEHTANVNKFLAQYPQASKSRRIKRDALRALRGSILRSELYALDRFENQDTVGPEDRPYTVAEHAYGLVEISPPSIGDENRLHIFFPHVIAQRTIQWERGEDPMTQFIFTDYKNESDKFDTFGRPHRQTAIAMPRRSSKQHAITGAVVGQISPDETHVLATHTWTAYAEPQPDTYMYDRVSQVKTYELSNLPTLMETSPEDVTTVLKDQWSKAQVIHNQFILGANIRLFGHVLNHYDGEGFEGDPDPSKAGQYGALSRSEALAFTDEILEEAYAGDPNKPSRRPKYLGGEQDLPADAPAGFGNATGYEQKIANDTYEAGYYVDTKRVKYDFQDLGSKAKCGLIVGMQGALGHETQIIPDAYWFMPISVKDAAGLETKAEYNYRTMQPKIVTDPNDNKTCFTYNPIGLVEKMWLEPRNSQGGSESKPELWYIYRFLAFEQTRAEKEPIPIFVHTTARPYHANAPVPAGILNPDEKIESREYSDGFGRLIQKRTQAENLIFGGVNETGQLTGDDVGLLINGKPVAGQAKPAAVAHDVADCVVVSGWQVYDNKGRVVEKYEPFFDKGWEYQGKEDAVCGQHVTMIYDPRGQVIRTHNPDGSEQWVLYGVPGKISAPDLTSLDEYEPTPWEGYTYDANDLAEITFHPDDPLRDLTDVAKDNNHYYTPTSTLLDGLGRAICQVQRNGQDPATDAFVTRSTYDVRGNLLSVFDALGREAFIHAYDLLNRPLRVDSIDAGLRTSVLDAQGNLIEYRDSKGSIVLHQYDELNRPTGIWALNNSTQNLTRREWIIYGEKSGLADAKDRNLLGKPYIHYDEAGKLTFERYDFKGNLTDKVRKVVSDAEIAGGWLANWTEGQAANDTKLEANSYQTGTAFDALNRPVTVTYPEDVTGHAATLTPTYNRAGALQSVKLDNEIYVDFIAYNAKGQRVLIAYGNEIMTRYAYDPHTFRLVRLRTEKYSQPDAKTWESASTANLRDQLFQEFTYQYDLAGNITTIFDRSPESGIPNTLLGTDALDRVFAYDPIYRLLSATGREYAAAQPNIWDDPFQLPGTNHQDPTLTSPYTQTFQYDPAGNMGSCQNSATKTFHLANNQNGKSSNRLATVTFGKRLATQVTYRYIYDDNGNMTGENTERHFDWDQADRMIGFHNQATPTAPPSVEARYLYDSTGMRVKKWVRTNGTGDGESTTYIDGIFEYHTWKKNGQVGETNHLHIMDNQSRVAIKRVGDVHPEDKGETVQYHLGDHLGSSNVVIGGAYATSDGFINREEYYPYGETSFGSFGKKRYRFTSKERDEESGLYYHGARYYSPWLARWVTCDWIIGQNASSNLYLYVNDKPVVAIDPSGMEKIVVTGGEYPTRKFRMDFVETSLQRLEEYKKGNPSDKPTWIIMNPEYEDGTTKKPSYSKEELLEFTKIGIEKGYEIKVFYSAEELRNYLNSKSRTGPEISSERLKDPVTNFDVFAHGYPGSIELGYRSVDQPRFSFGETMVKDLDPRAFSGAKIDLNSCNPATVLPNGGNLVKQFSEQTGSTVYGYEGRTDYTGINKGGLSWEKMQNSLNRKEKGFNPAGSLNYPKAGTKADAGVSTHWEASPDGGWRQVSEGFRGQ